MPESFVISNFKYGLDTRRSELTSMPGTLQELVDCHINQGGEIEKRKAFTLFGSAGPQNAFGLEVTSSGVVVFGSVPQVDLVPALPEGVGYVQCVHPNGTQPMSAILSSTSIGGYAWCSAKFTDGSVFGYYNGQLVYDFTNGLILPNLDTNEAIVDELIAEINRVPSSAYTAAAGSFENEFDVTGQVGTTFAVGQNVNTTDSGVITDEAISTGFAGTTSNPAVGQFSIMAGVVGSAGQNQIASITINGVEILGAAVDFVIDINHTATAVAAQVNSYQSTYVATVSNNVVTFTSSSSNGASYNGYVLHVTVGGTVGAVVCWNGPQYVTLVAGASTTSVETIYNDGGDMLNGAGPVSWGSEYNYPPYGDITVNSITTLCQAVVNVICHEADGGLVNNATGVAVGQVLYLSTRSMYSTDSSQSLIINMGTGGEAYSGTQAILTAQASPSGVNVSRSGAGGAVTCYVSNGVPPYTYSWSWISGDGYLQPASPSSQTTTWYETYGNLQASGGTDYFACTVTDSAGSTATSNVIQVTYPPL